MTGPEIHRTARSLTRWEAGWRMLASATPGSSYFTTPDWVLASWETMRARESAEIATWSAADGSVEAVVPIRRATARLHPRIPVPVTSWTLLGSEPDAADHGLLLTSPHRRDDVRRWLVARTRGRSLWFPAMDADADHALLPAGTRRLAASTCPRLTLASDAAVGSAGFRSLMRRRERQLAQTGVTFRWIPPELMTPDVLDTVVALHRKRQDEMGNTTAFGTHRRGFHLRLQARADRDRGPAVLLAEHEGAPVGALYGFLWQDVFAYYNGGWEQAYAKMSLGTVLLNRAIAVVTELGVTTFDFLRGAESYKYRSFGAQDRYDEQWLRPRSPSALLAGAVLRHARRRTGNNEEPETTN
jgi:CelD/BcsL family acetyltransferase involved in cellulose biosynthesis